MFTIDIDIPAPPTKKKSGDDNPGDFYLYHLTGNFYLPKGLLSLIMPNPSALYKETISFLHYISLYKSHLYVMSNNLGISSHTNQKGEKDAWSFNIYIKSLSPLDNTLEIIDYFLIMKIKDINEEENISNGTIDEIKDLIYYSNIQINEIKNKDEKRKINEDFFKCQ